MKKVIIAPLLATVAASISSCGLSTAEVNLLLKAQENEYVLRASENNLRAAQALKESEKSYSSIQGLDPTVAAMVVMSENYSRSMENAMNSMAKIVSAVTGNSLDGTNVYDVVRESVRQKGETTRSITSSVVALGKWGFGAWALDKVTDNVFSKAGNTNNFNNNGDASADNSSPWEYNWHNQRDTISTNGGSTGTDDFTFEPTDLEVPVE